MQGSAPADDLEELEGLAWLAEKEPEAMTMAEIYDWAIAWAKRETLRLKIARGETPTRRIAIPSKVVSPIDGPN